MRQRLMSCTRRPFRRLFSCRLLILWINIDGHCLEEKWSQMIIIASFGKCVKWHLVSSRPYNGIKRILIHQPNIILALMSNICGEYYTLGHFNWLLINVIFCSSYVVSFIVQFQIYKGACILAGEYDPNSSHSVLSDCDIYQSAEAGNALK